MISDCNFNPHRWTESQFQQAISREQWFNPYCWTESEFLRVIAEPRKGKRLFPPEPEPEPEPDPLSYQYTLALIRKQRETANSTTT